METLIVIALWLLLLVVQPFGIWMITASPEDLTRIESLFPVRGRWTRYWGYLLVLLVPVLWIIAAFVSTSGGSRYNTQETVPLYFALVFILFLDTFWILLTMGLVRVVRWTCCQIRQARTAKAVRPECPLRSGSGFRCRGK